MKLKNILYTLATAIMTLCLAACSPDGYDLGDKDVTSADLKVGTAFSVTHDSNNPNIVYLKSLMASNYQVTWLHPQGRSNENEIELHIPFPGTYEVQFGVITRGGVVMSQPVEFTVDDFYAGFVDGELWTNLTGGVGSSKVWIPDNGTYGQGAGSLSYGDPSLPWGLNNFTPNWEPGGFSMLGSDNYGRSEFTFDLIDGAHVTSKRIDDDGSETVTNGTFLIDTDNAKLNLTDVELMHPSAWNHATDATGWQKDIQIISLTENRLQLGIVRNPDTSGEGKWYLVFNFVSKEYAENYEGPEIEEFPTLEDGWRDFVEPKTDKLVTYQLSGFDWFNRDGSAKGVTSVAALAEVEDVTITLDSGTGEYELNDISGNTHKGKYTLSNDGIYTFSPALPTFNLSADGRAQFRTNADGTMRIMDFTQAKNCNSQTGGLETISWGVDEYDDMGKAYQYMGYNWTVVRAGVKKTYQAILHTFDSGFAFTNSDPVFIEDGVDADYTFTVNAAIAPYGVYLDVVKILDAHPNCDIVIKDIKVDGSTIEFSDTEIDRGEGDDGPACARRYIVNPWGATAVTADRFVTNSSLQVTIHVVMDNGEPFIKPSSSPRKRK